MRPGYVATLVVLALSLVNGMGYLARRRVMAPSVSSPAAPAQDVAPMDAGGPVHPAPPVAVAAAPTVPPPAPEKQDDSGLLLVTTIPRGILVEVDGEGRDLTPARLQLPTGRHQVVLKEGTRVLVDEPVEILRGSAAVVVHTLDAPPSVPSEEPVVAVQAPP